MSDYEIIQRRRNITVGIFVVIAACSLVWLIFRFGDLPVFISRWRSFEVRVQFQSAPGVQDNTIVRFCGYQIGRVTKIEPPKVLKDLNTGQFYHQTVVVIGVDKKYDDIPADVETKLMMRGLGSSYIEFRVRPFDVRKPLKKEFLTTGSLLQGSVGSASEFFPEESQKRLEELMDGLSILVRNTNDILGDEQNKGNIKRALANISEASEQVAQALKEFREFFVSGTNASEELGKAAAQLRMILEKINDGQGTVARVLNDGQLYENLLENTQQMQAFLQELKSFLAKASDKGVPIKLK